MSQCCSGNCDSCGGCAGHLVLSQPELELLQVLAQNAFLPVARRMEDPTPVYLEDDRQSPQQYSLVLQCLEKKGLISLDFDKPLRGFSMEAYAAYPIHGSMALTERGQKVLEMIEYQGIHLER